MWTRDLPRTHAEDVLKGVVAGALGGIAAAWAMNQVGPLFRAVAARWRERSGSNSPSGTQQDSGRGNGQSQQEETPNVKVASIVSKRLLGHELTQSERPVAGSVVHYATGASMGAAYGLLSELVTTVSRDRGLLFGTAVWIGLDETALAVLGLAKPPTQYPPSTHALGLAGHLVYGLTTDALRRLIRCAID
jgi:Protein of unknown function (DUF1440)